MPDFPDFSERLVREPERARITGVSRAHWANMEAQGQAPKRILIGVRTIAWRLSDLLKWVERAAVPDTPEARARRAPPVPSPRARGVRRASADVEEKNADAT